MTCVTVLISLSADSSRCPSIKENLLADQAYCILLPTTAEIAIICVLERLPSNSGRSRDRQLCDIGPRAEDVPEVNFVMC